jgi:Tfp pilus assembly protein PilX
MSEPDVRPIPREAAGKNENGFVLITVMMVMLLLLGLALAAAQGSLLELLISRNNREYTESFYQAESCVKELATKLDAATDRYELRPEDRDNTTQGAWIQPLRNANSDELATLADIAAIWNNASPDDSAPFFDPPPSDVKALKNILKDTADIKSTAIRRGAVGGDQASSLNMGSGNPGGPPVIQYEIFGQARKKTAAGGSSPSAVVSLGYKKRDPS